MRLDIYNVYGKLIKCFSFDTSMRLKKISEFEFGVGEVGKVFVSDELVGAIDEKSLEQIGNVAGLPGVVGKSLAMPDVHCGYGFPIGGVAAFDLETGVICPGGVGYDINCSVRLLRTNLKEVDLVGREEEVLKVLREAVPSGVGVKGKISLSMEELDDVLRGGAQWAVGAGYGVERDWKFVEDFGKLDGRPEFVSQKARGRGLRQLGTLGAGNHFVDILVVDEVFDEEVARVFGLELGQVVIMIHCGSRGLGHQVAGDYMQEMKKDAGACNVDSELVGVGIGSELGKRYFGAMCAAANFAFANKQVITHYVREGLGAVFGGLEIETVYEVCHNIAKVEEYDGRSVLVIRKGATRSFGYGHEDIVEAYRNVGSPVLLPGSMGSSSFVLVGTKEAEKKSWGSCAHGAGRVASRSEMHRRICFDEAVGEMKKRGIFVSGNKKGMVEESPLSYKNVDEVVRVCDEVGLGRKVVRLRPKLVLIG